MSSRLQRSDWFWADLTGQVDWYRDAAGSEVAERFVEAVEATLKSLARAPGLGRRRFSGWPELEGIRSFRVQRPFHRLLIFYRCESGTVYAERLIHGARDLPHRLRESPYDEL
ncbi:MAG: type II toxin-antitoxin system RelE/ParE family toxin [Verrucomicrobia bacterium]|nr:type II toxin-antitoxin system RelE/ParE family toxin [Verrucomicrobiota bacterium]